MRRRAGAHVAMFLTISKSLEIILVVFLEMPQDKFQYQKYVPHDNNVSYWLKDMMDVLNCAVHYLVDFSTPSLFWPPPPLILRPLTLSQPTQTPPTWIDGAEMIEEADPIYSKLRLIDSTLPLQTGVWKPRSTPPRDTVGSTQPRMDGAGASVNYWFAFILFHANNACCLFQCCLSGLALLPRHTRRFCRASFPAKKHFRRVSELFHNNWMAIQGFTKRSITHYPVSEGNLSQKIRKTH